MEDIYLENLFLDWNRFLIWGNCIGHVSIIFQIGGKIYFFDWNCGEKLNFHYDIICARLFCNEFVYTLTFCIHKFTCISLILIEMGTNHSMNDFDIWFSVRQMIALEMWVEFNPDFNEQWNIWQLHSSFHLH